MVTRITRDTINELNIQPLIAAMPNYKSFFYTFHSVEPIEIGRLQDDYIESIEHIKGGYVLLTSDAIVYSDAFSYLTSVKRLVDLYLHLMQAVKMLNNASIIHLKICFKNIIVKDGTLPLLSGLEHATLSPDKTIRNPIECRAVRYIIDNKLASISSNTILNICRDNKEEQTFLSKYINQPSAEIIASLLTRSSTWNVYSLNEMILSLLNNPIKPDSFLYKWKQLLEQGVATNNRGNADYFLKQTKELMYAADIADLITTTTASSAALL
jgi:hypothetical protein